MFHSAIAPRRSGLSIIGGVMALLITPMVLYAQAKSDPAANTAGTVAPAPASAPTAQPPRLPVAGLTTVYHHNSHADMFLSRLMITYTLDKKGDTPSIRLASLFMDQPDGLTREGKTRPDIGKDLAAEANVPLFPTIAQALSVDLSGEKNAENAKPRLDVQGVLLIAEHGDYPKNQFNSTVYPKRRFFDETVKVFKETGKVVPVFVDKHLADNWEDAKHIYDTAKELNIPLMAGSSLPITWRKPAVDVTRDAKLQEIVVLSYHTLDHYGFHAMEILQCLAERRAGGETGIKSVRTVSDEAAWTMIETHGFDTDLFNQAWDRLPRKLNGKRPLREAVKNPTIFVVEYTDGLKGYVITLNGAVGEWTAAWRYEDGKTDSAWFSTQEARPYQHFSYLLMDIEKMFHTGKPTWPVERTLLTSGALALLLQSKANGGEKIDTPQLLVKYRSDWDWTEPAPPPPGRPSYAQ